MVEFLAAAITLRGITWMTFTNTTSGAFVTPSILAGVPPAVVLKAWGFHDLRCFKASIFHSLSRLSFPETVPRRWS